MSNLESLKEMLRQLDEEITKIQPIIDQAKTAGSSRILSAAYRGEIAQAEQMMDQFKYLQMQKTALEKIIWLMELANPDMLVALDGFAELINDIAKGLSAETIAPIMRLVNKVLPAIGSIGTTTIREFEPSIIEAIGFCLNESVRISQGLKEAKEEYYSEIAQTKYLEFGCYLGAGFKREEAMALLLARMNSASMLPSSQGMSNLANSVGSGAGKVGGTVVKAVKKAKAGGNSPK